MADVIQFLADQQLWLAQATASFHQPWEDRLGALRDLIPLPTKPCLWLVSQTTPQRAATCRHTEKRTWLHP